MAKAKSRHDTDREFVQEVDDDIDAGWVRRTFNAAYGVGWQRRLANNLGIGESTLSGWLKSDDFPPSAKLALMALELRHDDRINPRWHPVKEGETYSVVSLDHPAGNVIARGIDRPEHARLIAAAPVLHEALGRAWVLVSDTSEVMDDLWADDAAFISQTLELLEATDEAKISKSTGNVTNAKGGAEDADESQ